VSGTKHSGGRNRLSRAEHELAGTARTDRHGAATDPPAIDPPKGRPDIPDGLSAHALAEWTRMVLRLEGAKTLSTIDDAVLYQYCCLWAETEGIVDKRRVTAALADTLLASLAPPVAEDVDVAGISAQIVKLRQLDLKYSTQLRQGHMAVRHYLVEFGMTPAARSRVKVAEAATPADPFGEFDPEANKK
jgi:P27 family predicted phage terminase small subunit